MAPTHTHDCKACNYLGTIVGQTPDVAGKPVDLYHCKNSIGSGEDGSVIARFSSDGPDYSSVPLDLIKGRAPGFHRPELHAAAALAVGWVD